MRDHDTKQNQDDLLDVKSLIGDADGGGFTLDDILAEYGHPSAPREGPKGEPEEDPEARFNTIEWA